VDTRQDPELSDLGADLPGAGRLAAGVTLGGGKYQNVGLIGRGAFGEVYRVTDRSSGQPAALRLLAPELLQGQAADRLRSELSVAGRLDQKNIARTLDFGIENDLVYVVTEFVDGQTLRALLSRKRAAGAAAFSLKGAYNVVAHVLNALSYAHQQRTIHGALSASNILVNKAGRVKLTEFGLARALPAFARLAAQNPEDIAAMAPEFSAAPQSVDRRADIYSVGAVLYELLTGRAPSESLVRPSAVVAGLPADIDQVIARCLAPQPADRFGDAMELKNLIHQIVERGGAQGASASLAPRAPAPQAAASQSMSRAPAQQAAPRVSAPQAAAVGGIAIDESEEKWLIQKNKLDFGPLNLIQVKEQIARDDILPGHVIIDNENGQRCKVEDHPLLHDLVQAATQRRDDARRANAEMVVVKQDKRKGITLYAVIALGAAVLLVGGYFGIKKLKGAEKKNVNHEIASLDSSEIHVKIAFVPNKPPPQRPKSTGPRPPRPPGGDPGGFDDDLDLGDASQGGGSERLSNDQMNAVIQAHGGSLARCVGGGSATIELIILGNGRVSGVRVDGSVNSPLANCLRRAFGGMQFPSFNGPRTKATFQIG
jgi:serine/threonine-protein kinase